MSKYVIDTVTLKAVADAIREKTGKGEPIPTEDFAAEIATIDREEALRGCIERSVEHVYIPVGTSKVSANIFREWYMLTGATLPDSVTVIENNAFHDCRLLREVRMSENLAEIKHYAFANCYLLTEIKIPKGVTKIGNSAFYDCRACRSYDFSDHTSVPEIGTSVFMLVSGTVDRVIVVPEALYLRWKRSAGWKTWASDTVSVGHASVNVAVQNDRIWLPGNNSGEHEADTSAVSAYCQREGDAKIPISSTENAPYGLNFWYEPYESGYDYQIRGDATFTEPGKYEIWVENGDGEKIYRRIINVT